MPGQRKKPLEPSDSVELDGRRYRTLETRRRIVRALTELTKEGQVTPTAEDVSLRANVGLRTVFRHFDDMETLYREGNLELQNLINATVHKEFESAHWQDRLIQGVRLRGKLYESITPFFIAAQVHRHESAVIDANVRNGIGLERAILKNVLPPHVAADKQRFEALLLVLSVDAWVRMRRDQGLSVSATVATIQLLVKSLLPPVPANPPRGAPA